MVCNRIYVNREVKTFKWEPKKEKELVKHRKSEKEQKRSTFVSPSIMQGSYIGKTADIPNVYFRGSKSCG